MIKLESNPINHLKLLKHFTFTDPYSFVDEIAQNASRAKAKKLVVSTRSGDTLILYNDGKVLEDPQALFSIAESNWDETVKEENPFGIGFFSIVAAYNKAYIRSGIHSINLDVNKLISGDPQGLIHNEAEKFLGFSLELSDPIIEVDMDKVQKRLEDISAYSDNLDIFFEGEELPKLDKFTASYDVDISTKVDEASLKGWVGLYQYGWSEELEIIYNGRSVKNFRVPYLKGQIHISSGVLDLRAPDRKDVIINDKMRRFEARITKIGKQLARIAVKSEYRSKYGEAIKRILEVEEYYANIKLHVLEGADIEGIERYFKSGIGTYSKFLAIEASKVPMPKPQAPTTVEKRSAVPYNFNREDVEYVGGGYSSGYVAESKIKMNTELYDYSEKLAFYVEQDNLSRYKTKIETMKKFNIPIVITMDALEKEVCEYYGMTHISKEFEPSIVFKSHVDTSQSFSKSDIRASRLLNTLSKEIIGREIFKLAKVTTNEIVEIPEIKRVDEKSLGEVPIVLSECKTFIYINPSLMEHSLRESTTDKMTITDYKFILRYIKDISALMGKVDNATNHEDKILELLGQ